MASKKEYRKRKPYREKSWTAFKAESSWQIFKIMSEFVEGYEQLNRIGPCISVYGSAKTKPSSVLYKTTVELSKRLVEEGFGVITGGGPGVMEAANKGAFEAGGKSVGVGIDLPMEQGNNDYIDRDKLVTCNYFFIRKVMLFRYAQGFVYMPGGFGTLDELSEALTLIQTHKISQLPIVLYGKEYWSRLLEFFTKTLLDEHNTINPEDLELMNVVDTVDEVIDIIVSFYASEEKHSLGPNF